MPKSNVLELEGQVTEVLKGLTFEVTTTTGHHVVAKPAGKLKLNKIRILLGDWVKVEVSPYDLSKGRITYRMGKKREEEVSLEEEKPGDKLV